MELIGQGRDADVYALDETRVLRRYRSGGRPTEREARLMTHLAASGFPVPEVHGATSTDLVLERVAGPTMLEVLARRPLQFHTLGRMLGALHDRLHAHPAPTWLPQRFGGTGDDRVLHLDLHPGNVILTGRGPVVIDWSNAAAGDPAADLAMTLVTVGGAEVPGLAARLGRGLLLHAVRRGSATDPGPRLAAAVEVKLTDPNLRPAEEAWLRRRAGRLRPSV
ncbi:phosphotransferase [Streptomyces indicus]|uniref:tRNA A-37 threonylcarbamoyl transferase component Bud32 n=1 Tax=Streptomyces indicus TaxID=417292 RepID=A0A1G8U6B4_9ACTN|nr:aminoglycoside phosphotransferase family protein [Streptomyces indicus]SDJ48665.1 tRNA A-37 threonylcarbamoyl transferase component Bud32 [Streptomyces indicus]